MDMKVKMETSDKVIRAYLEDEMGKYRQRIITWLHVIGEKCVNDARLQGSYKDRTGNLRGSTGYAVIDRGSVITIGGFKQVLDGKEGPRNGRAYLNGLISENELIGPTLIVVAGMKYAYYVHDRGYNVLDSAELLAEKLVTELQAKLSK